jgi:hypothetical protein
MDRSNLHKRRREFNMRKLLGNVSVYLDEQETSESSRATKLDGHNYEITLTPKVDKYQMESRGLPYNRQKTTMTTLAHEFGHVIGRILNSPVYGTTGEDAPMIAKNPLAAEREAWAIAEIEMPGLDKNEERAALGMDEETYG